MLPDGFTIAVGALDLATDSDSEDRIPFLGEIPILGEAFKSRNHSLSRNRFYVFVRAEVMRYNNFEDLKFLSGLQGAAAGIADGWPEVEPRIIK
jgi:type II secretory pathway component GspD/PulD (secretin)